MYRADVNVNLMVENVIQIKSGCECKKHHICEKDYIWNPGTCSCENSKCLEGTIDSSVILCDEIIGAEETTTIPKNIICETKSFYALLTFSRLTTALLIAFSIIFA